MFRSFFPNPRIFFSSAVVWLLFLVGVWFTVGEGVRSAISIDRFFAPPVCAASATPADQSAAAPANAASEASSEVAADTASVALLGTG